MFDFQDATATASEQRAFTGPEEWVQLREQRGATVRRSTRGGWMVTCPAHHDRTPSLELRAGHSQPVVFKCWAGCAHDDVLAADGLTWGHVLYRQPGRSDPRRSGPSRAQRRIDALRTADAATPPPLLSSFSFVVLRCDLSLRRRTWAWDLWPEPPWRRPGASHELVLPKGAGRVMGAVAADLVGLANHRITNGELRTIPYSQRFGARRLDVNPGSVRRALRTLAAHGVIAATGSLPGRASVSQSIPGRFDLKHVRPWQLDAPPPWEATGATLWALRVEPVPLRSRRVECADRVADIDFEAVTASEAASRVREPHAELGLEARVALADLGVR